MRVRGRPRRAVALSLVSLFLGCAGGDPETSEVDVVVADSVPEPPLVEPEVPTVAGEGDPRLFRVLLVNESDQEARVFAAAGAARVALDTVPGQDSLRVDIRVRADRVDLEAEDAAGRSLKRETLEMTVDSVTRWVIAAPTVSLVTDLGRNYPRTRSTRPLRRR